MRRHVRAGALALFDPHPLTPLSQLSLMSDAEDMGDEDPCVVVTLLPVGGHGRPLRVDMDLGYSLADVRVRRGLCGCGGAVGGL